MSLPQRWLVVRTRVRGDRDGWADLVAHGLTQLGGRAVQEEDDGWLVTHLPEPRGTETSGDPASPSTADAPIASEEWRQRLAAETGIPSDALEVETAWQEHGDWAQLWKEGLAPRRLTSRLVVTPSWCEPEVNEGDLVITVDPGMAFGNAEHGTTRGCLRILDATVRSGNRILDVGAGSAILSIAAALLGASEVRAVEMDELAIPTARENVERNGVADRVRVDHARLDAAGVAEAGPHDGVVANIEAGYLKPLLPGLVAAVAPGGWLLLSGILDHEEAEMREWTEGAGTTWVETDADGEWRSILFRRP